MQLTKKVKKYGGTYVITVDKSLIDDGVLNVDTYYNVTIEQCHR
jgi:hypothetical protein